MIKSGYLTKGDSKWKQKVEKAISIVVNKPKDFIKINGFNEDLTRIYRL